MTENEVLESALEKVKAQKINFGFMERFNVDENWEVMKALEEIQQYRAIGTIEEFKALKEKNTPKKVNIQQWIYTKCECGYEFSKHHGDGYYSIPYKKQTKHCPDCGQKLDWQ